MKKLSEIDWSKLSHQEIDALLFQRICEYEQHIFQNGNKRPKKEGFIIERIASMDNLREADREAQKGKRMRKIISNGVSTRVPDKHIKRHNKNAEEELRALQMMILTMKFPLPKYRLDRIKSDAGKVRDIVKQHYYPWRILQHAILRVTSPYICKSLIVDNFACIKGKGLHFGMERVKNKMRRHPELRWFWKTDFKKYYQSVPHHLIMESLSKIFKDKMFLELMDKVILSYESGDEIEQLLDYERRRNERNPYWGSVKSNIRQPILK